METIVSITEINEDQGGYKVATTEHCLFLAIDNTSSCCESWGWFFCNDNPQDFVGAQLLDVFRTDTALVTKKIEELGDLASGGTMFVNLTTNRGVLQFVAYNSHNGYYGHKVQVLSLPLQAVTLFEDVL